MEEIDPRWRKSSYSDNGGNCVEVATNPPHIVAMRDSKNPAGPALSVSAQAWSSFVRGIKHGEFDF
jgi:predicted secreted Zn-dependent protease